MFSEDDALKLAQVRVEELGLRAGQDFKLLEEQTVKLKNGWAFFYNSAEFIRTGDVLYALAGNGPIHISHSGKLTQLPTATPWEEVAKRLT